jgi:hypothetical protein
MGMTVSVPGMLMPGLAVSVSGNRMLLRLIMPTMLVVMRGLQVVKRSCLMVGGGIVMVFCRRMLSHASLPLMCDMHLTLKHFFSDRVPLY